MDAFERHGIRWLSPSSLGMWRENPGLWGLKYLGGFKEDAGPAAWRGSAVEGGLNILWRDGSMAEALTAALGAFEANAMGEVSDDIDAERDLIKPMLETLANATRPHGAIMAYQLKIEARLDDVPVPIIGYIDFAFEDGLIVDLKTTKACPSAIKPEHARQVALYMEARGSDYGSVLYATAKKWASFPVENKEEAVASIRRDALSLKRFLERFETPRSALGALPMNVDHYFWSDAAKAKLFELEAAA